MVYMISLNLFPIDEYKSNIRIFWIVVAYVVRQRGVNTSYAVELPPFA